MLKEIKHLLTHSAIYGIMNILAKGVGFIMIPIYTHYISPTDYGVYELLELVVTVTGIFLGAGIVNAVARFYFLYDDEKERNAVISSAIYCLCGILFLFIPVIYFFAPDISVLIFDTPEKSFLLRLIFISFAFNSILEIPLSYIRFTEKPILFAVLSLMRLCVQLGLNIYFVVYREAGILGIVYSSLIVSTLFGTFLITSLLYRVGWACRRDLTWEMIKFGSPLIISNLGMFIIHFADRFYLKKYTSLADVGIYSLGYKMGFLITFLIGQPFCMIWNYWRYTLINQKDGERIYAKIFLLFFGILLFGWLGLSLFSKELITIMADQKYYMAYKVVPIVAMAYVFREVSDYFKGIFFIEKSTGIMSGITIGISVCSLILYTIFIPRWGTLGAAWATLGTFVLLSCIYFIMAGKIRYINYHIPLVFACFILALIIFTLGFYANLFLSPRITFILKFFLFLTFPYIFYIIILSSEEKVLVQNIIRNYTKKFI